MITRSDMLLIKKHCVIDKEESLLLWRLSIPAVCCKPAGRVRVG